MSDANWQPWVAGAIAGSAQCLLGHPFDTAKVRMQASSIKYRSTAHCISSTVRTEGALALYKGLPPAMLTACTTSGLRFGVQHQFNSWLAGWLTASSSSTKPSFEALPAAARILAEGGGGAACGLVLPLVYTPMELIKCRRQVLTDNKITNLAIARAVWREGGLAGLYVGHRLTVMRSTIGNAVLFGSFEAWRALLSDASGAPAGSMAVLMGSGVLSGWTTQLFTFPIDAAKSRAQVAVSGGGSLGVLGGLGQLWREGAMYRGLSAMLLRAVPVHLVYLPLFGLIMGALGSQDRRPGRAEGGTSGLLRRVSSRSLDVA